MDPARIKELARMLLLAAAWTAFVVGVPIMIWAAIPPREFERKERWRRGNLSQQERDDEDRIEKEDFAGF